MRDDTDTSEERLVNTTYRQEGGCGFTLLGILFIGLKLTGYIDWSWLWVLAPFWAPFALGVTFLGVMFALSLRYR
jgi:hypothetical protein